MRACWGPPLLWLAIFSSPLWLSSIVFLVSLAFAATALALLVVTALFRLIGPKNTRILAQIFSALAGAGVFLAFQYFNITSGRSRDEEQAAMAEYITSLDIDPTPGGCCPARAFTGDIVSTLIWVALVAASSRSRSSSSAAASWATQPPHPAWASASASRMPASSICAAASWRPSSARKFRLLRRDPLLLSQIGMQLLYLPAARLHPVAARRIVDHYARNLRARPHPAGRHHRLQPDLDHRLGGRRAGPHRLRARRPAHDRPRQAGSRRSLPVLVLMTLPLIALLWRDLAAGALDLGRLPCREPPQRQLIGLWRRTPGSRREFAGGAPERLLIIVARQGLRRPRHHRHSRR
jgi:ABC-2 type transport system permease protein